MSIPVASFISVSITVGAAAVDRFAFGNYMIVGEHNITANRMDGPYTSLAEVVSAGFSSSAAPTLYYASEAAFGVDNPVDEIYIGRKIPSTGGTIDQAWQVDASGAPDYVDETVDANDAGAGDWAIFPTVEAIGDYMLLGQTVPFSSVTFSSAAGTAGVDAGSLALAYEFWNGEAWTALSGVSDGTTMFTAVAGAGQVFAFTEPSTWAAVALGTGAPALIPRYYIRFRITAGAYSTNPLYTSAYITGDTSWANAFTAIEAVEGPDAWYGHTITSRVQADIEGVASWTNSRFHRYVPQSADAAFLAGTAGNVALILEAAGYKKVAGPLYHGVSSGSANGYADAAWSSACWGFDLDGVGGNDNWMYQTLTGITADNINSTQAAAIWDANGNVYAATLGSSFTSKGTSAAGAPYFQDIQTTMDWFERRVQEDLLEYMIANRPTFTNAGIQAIGGVVMKRLELGITCGHFSPDVRPTVTVPDSSDVSSADKTARLLRINCTAVFANFINTLNLTLNVTFT
jgi:hypothetical protein